MDDQTQDLNQVADEIKNMMQGSATSPQSAMDKFTDELIKEKGFVAISDEVRNEIKKDLANRLDEFMAARIITALSDKDVVIFENMLKEKKSNEEIQAFVADHVPDFVNFLANTMLEFRNVYLGITEAPRVVA